MNKEKVLEKVILALEIRDYIHKILNKHGVITECCTDGVNPFYNQTDENCEGFICEYYYGFPSKIDTPLGHININTGFLVCNSDASNALEEIEKSLGLKLKKEAYITQMGEVGGFYHITKFPLKNLEFPCDCIEKKRSDYIYHEVVRDIIKEIGF